MRLCRSAGRGWARFIAGLAVLSSCLLLPAATVAAPATSAGARWTILGPARGQAHLYLPTSVGVDARGIMYVADAGNNRIVKLSPKGRVLRQWNVSLSPGDLPPPTWLKPALAVDRRGDVYLALPNVNKIVKFSSQGRHLATWSSFLEPRAVAVGGQGNVFVADTGHRQIVKLSPDGQVLRSWAVAASAVAVDGSGRLYVPHLVPGGPNTSCNQDAQACPDIPDRWNLEQLSPAGRHLAFLEIAHSLYDDRARSEPVDLAADDQGDIYVATSFDGVVKLDQHGAQSTLGGQGVGWGQFDYPAGIAMGPRGNLFVADYWNDRVQRLSPTGTFQAAWGSAGTAQGWFATPEGVATDASESLYVNDARDSRIQQFSPLGVPLAQPNRDTILSNPGDELTPYGSSTWAQQGIALDRQGNVYAARDDRVSEVSPSGKELDSWGQPYQDQSVVCRGLALDSSGNLWVAASDGHPLFEVPPGTHNMQATDIVASAIAFDASGNAYVADDETDRIVKYSPNWNQIGAWGSEGHGQGEFQAPQGIAVDAVGDIYVADTGNDRIVKLSPQGAFLTAWGSAGSGLGQFHLPVSVAVDSKGTIYVADAGNNRIQRLGAG